MSRRKILPLAILKFLVTKLSNQDNKVSFIGVDKYEELPKSSACMWPCNRVNITIERKAGYVSSLNGRIKRPNITLANTKRSIMMKSSNKKEP